jgi:hypothetical protein
MELGVVNSTRQTPGDRIIAIYCVTCVVEGKNKIRKKERKRERERKKDNFFSYYLSFLA